MFDKEDLKAMSKIELKTYKKELEKRLNEVKEEIRCRPPTKSLHINNIKGDYVVMLKYSEKNKKKSEYIGAIKEDNKVIENKINEIDPSLLKVYFKKLNTIKNKLKKNES